MPTLSEIDNYPVPDMLIPRIAEEHGLDTAEAAMLLREAKRMLYLSSLGHRPISPSVRVDWAWHEMLMFTRFYQEFADYIGRFVHHDPTPGPPGGGDWYRTTKENYKKVFGEEPSPKYWP